MQGHGNAFAFCVQNNDLAGAQLMVQMLNQDLPEKDQIKIGHGIDFKSINTETDPELKLATLIDPDCEQCKSSNSMVDIHPPPTAWTGQDRLHIKSHESHWLITMGILVEGRISSVGYKRGWWNE